jgi:hypothetical protein
MIRALRVVAIFWFAALAVFFAFHAQPVIAVVSAGLAVLIFFDEEW